jgi:glutamate/tyrosine decarboxylase-like PLP-dependent enzyme
MYPPLAHDRAHFEAVLGRAQAMAAEFLRGLPERAAAHHDAVPTPPAPLPREGAGALAALARFERAYLPGINGSAGPRYWGFVTGGSTPAAVAGDWLVSAFDQNATGEGGSSARALESETIAMLRTLFGLSSAHTGMFVTGATMANMTGLALAREWAAREHGRSAAADGLYGLTPPRVLAGAAHSSTYKALAMLGMGRAHLHALPLLPGREAVDVAALRAALETAQADGVPVIVAASAGTVNTVDFDDLAAIAALKAAFGFWLHVDAAFGGFAACSPRYRARIDGLDAADSITIDAHKWLNVPYDAAMQFTRHRALQTAVFRNSAAYLGAVEDDDPGSVHLTPENSRRWRALPAWMTLVAYGEEGVRAVVEACCDCAADLGARIEASPHFDLLAPVRMNVVCFAPRAAADHAAVQRYLDAVRETGEVFVTPTVYAGRPGVRAAFSNWQTAPADVARAWAALEQAAAPV